jgi:hypothetical protein
VHQETVDEGGGAGKGNRTLILSMGSLYVEPDRFNAQRRNPALYQHLNTSRFQSLGTILRNGAGYENRTRVSGMGNQGIASIRTLPLDGAQLPRSRILRCTEGAFGGLHSPRWFDHWYRDPTDPLFQIQSPQQQILRRAVRQLCGSGLPCSYPHRQQHISQRKNLAPRD